VQCFMNKAKTLLFVGAHPDDETFAIGGTLAHYAAAGVKVYYACATRGEVGTADEASMRGFASVGDMRWAELECAARALGLAGVVYLGYRDSGMAGWPDNKHPGALAMAPLEQVAGRVVKVIRELKPEVVITHDAMGGYRHPDHVAVHKAAAAAFNASGDPALYPEAGPAFQPQKLYFSVFRRGLLRLAVRLMPLFGMDPHRFGRNKDIDLAGLVAEKFPVHASIRLDKKTVAVRDRATACYRSQTSGSTMSRLFGFVSRLSVQRDSYMRAYPPITGKQREKDLFEGIT